MFQFPPFAPSLRDGTSTAAGGFPHSEIPGSSRICRSPGLIAAYHVLPRLHEPRYPPFALLSFPLLLASLRTPRFVSRFLRLSNMSKIIALCEPVENKGLEPLTPCVQGRCSKPTELIPPSGLTLFFFLRHFLVAVFHNFREEPSQETPASRSPERRCSSRTFRYGYLVTT